MKQLTSRHRIAIDALLHAPTVQAASELCGAPVRTLYDWRRDPDFAAALTERRKELTEGVFNGLRRRMTEATDVLYELMQNVETPAGTRLQAARTLLEFGCRTIELQDIVPRVEALEDVLRDEREAQRNRP